MVRLPAYSLSGTNIIFDRCFEYLIWSCFPMNLLFCDLLLTTYAFTFAGNILNNLTLSKPKAWFLHINLWTIHIIEFTSLYFQQNGRLQN